MNQPTGGENIDDIMVQPPVVSFKAQHPFTDLLREGAWLGVEVATVTLIVTVALEIASRSTVRALLSSTNDDDPVSSLYARAWWYNVRNQFVWGVPVMALGRALFCRRRSNDDETTTKWHDVVFTAALLVTFHAVSYYAVHRAFHTVPGWYRHHKFHHRFRRHVPPSAANAVESVEYLVAYVAPLAVGTVLFRPSVTELRLALYVLSVSNLLVHTPCLEGLSGVRPICPAWWVSTADHMEHHRRLTVYYASPIINVDWWVQQFQCCVERYRAPVKDA